MKYLKKYQKTIIICFLLILSIIIICIGSSYSLYKIETKGQVHNTIVTGTIEEVCSYENGYVWNFDYTGDEQTFIVPCSGTYKLETWGAQGGNISSTIYGGYGAYSKGETELNRRNSIYINVGGQGTICDKSINGICENSGGYNGGGNSRNYYVAASNYQFGAGGGGATHISKNSGLLKNQELQNIFIISSGGGGAGSTYYSNTYYNNNGGAGGGISGVSGTENYPSKSYIGTGGTQSSGGYCNSGTDSYLSGSFGAGGNSELSCGAGGGAGYYGGGSANRGHASAGGGSSYIGNTILTNKTMYCYNCQGSNVESTKTVSTTCTSATPTENCAKQGNGYAKITLIQSNNNVLPPEISESEELQTKKIVSVTTPGQANSGVNYYEYFITQENITPTKDTIPTGTTDSEVEISTVGINYVFYRTVSNVGIKSNWSEGYEVIFTPCEYDIGYVWNFDYNGTDGSDGSIQEFVVPCDGIYKLETWGAQGGTVNINYTGGVGGYASGSVTLGKSDVLYAAIGGTGRPDSDMNVNVCVAGGYNGGGTACGYKDKITSSGGGASNFSFMSGTIKEIGISNLDKILIIAAGGGGAGYQNSQYAGSGGNGGGYLGTTGTYTVNYKDAWIPNGATQTSGGSFKQYSTYTCTNSGFGYGGGAQVTTSGNASGGGGGLYGGGLGNLFNGAGGGSGYIGNPVLTNKVMYCYNCTESNEETTKTVSTTCISETPTVNCAKQGNGYAKITLLSIE